MFERVFVLSVVFLGVPSAPGKSTSSNRIVNPTGLHDDDDVPIGAVRKKLRSLFFVLRN